MMFKLSSMTLSVTQQIFVEGMGMGLSQVRLTFEQYPFLSAALHTIPVYTGFIFQPFVPFFVN